MHKNFKIFLISLFTLSLTALMWSIINTLFLAKLPTNYIYVKKDTNFYNIHLEKLFNHTIVKKPKKIEPLKGIKLKAVFENGNNSFVIIDDKKDTFVDINTKYKGYKLIKVTTNSAIFTKNNKNFEIKLNKIKTPKYITPTQTYQKEVTKQTLKNYIQNPKKIWQNIGIIKTSNGYKITFIKKGSIFEKLGLKKGDYIIEVNNQPLKTDADAWNIYKHINEFDEIDIKIKRNNIIKELNYEIY